LRLSVCAALPVEDFVFHAGFVDLCTLKNNLYLNTKTPINLHGKFELPRNFKKKCGIMNYFSVSIRSQTKLHMACALKNKTTGDGDE
jgi:hypothetical protein